MSTDARAWLAAAQDAHRDVLDHAGEDGSIPLLTFDRLMDQHPAMAAALTAVLDLHQPERRYLPYEGADVSYDTPEEATADMEYDDADGFEDVPYFDLCAHCKVIEDSPCEGECTRETGYRESLYPCPTVRAITDHLPGGTP